MPLTLTMFRLGLRATMQVPRCSATVRRFASQPRVRVGFAAVPRISARSIMLPRAPTHGLSQSLRRASEKARPPQVVPPKTAASQQMSLRLRRMGYIAAGKGIFGTTHERRKERRRWEEREDKGLTHPLLPNLWCLDPKVRSSLGRWAIAHTASQRSWPASIFAMSPTLAFILVVSRLQPRCLREWRSCGASRCAKQQSASFFGQAFQACFQHLLLSSLTSVFTAASVGSLPKRSKKKHCVVSSTRPLLCRSWAGTLSRDPLTLFRVAVSVIDTHSLKRRAPKRAAQKPIRGLFFYQYGHTDVSDRSQ